MTNHPKQGGIASFMTAIGALALAGRPPSWPALDSDTLQDAFKAGPVEARTASVATPSSTTAALESLRTRARPLSETALPLLHQRLQEQSGPMNTTMQGTKASKRTFNDRIARFSGYPASFATGMFPDRWPWTLAEQVQSVASHHRFRGTNGC